MKNGSFRAAAVYNVGVEGIAISYSVHSGRRFFEEYHILWQQASTIMKY